MMQALFGPPPNPSRPRGYQSLGNIDVRCFLNSGHSSRRNQVRFANNGLLQRSESRQLRRITILISDLEG
jgi:hypothetical protein